MNDYPRIVERDGSILIAFAAEAERSKRQELKMVLDLNQKFEIIGIEIINLSFNLGRDCLRLINTITPTGDEGIKCRYDETCDAFYLRLRLENSWIQKAVCGSVLLDTNNQMVGLIAEWAPTAHP